jgi:hypothetical protein
MIALTRNPKETGEAIELAGGYSFKTSLNAIGVRLDSDQGAPFWTPGVADS